MMACSSMHDNFSKTLTWADTSQRWRLTGSFQFSIATEHYCIVKNFSELRMPYWVKFGRTDVLEYLPEDWDGWRQETRTGQATTRWTGHSRFWMQCQCRTRWIFQLERSLGRIVSDWTLCIASATALHRLSAISQDGLSQPSLFVHGRFFIHLTYLSFWDADSWVLFIVYSKTHWNRHLHVKEKRISADLCLGYCSKPAIDCLSHESSAQYHAYATFRCQESN